VGILQRAFLTQRQEEKAKKREKGANFFCFSRSFISSFERLIRMMGCAANGDIIYFLVLFI
jgi:hypothetical protein